MVQRLYNSFEMAKEWQSMRRASWEGGEVLESFPHNFQGVESASNVFITCIFSVAIVDSCIAERGGVSECGFVYWDM